MALMDGPHYEKAIKEIFRVLRPGGDLIFSITHPCFITKGIGWIIDDDGKYAKLTEHCNGVGPKAPG
jgi:ubiquinone/menaquinone biosynthesis C-methylase UbiE